MILNIEKPSRPKQLTLEDLQNLPIRVAMHNCVESPDTILYEFTIERIEGGWMYGVFHLVCGSEFTSQTLKRLGGKDSLADNCLRPYPDGQWNQVNWIELAE